MPWCTCDWIKATPRHHQAPPADAAPSVPAPSAEVQNSHPAIDLDKGVMVLKKVAELLRGSQRSNMPVSSSNLQLRHSTDGKFDKRTYVFSGIRMAAEAEADAWGLVWGGGPETSPDWSNRTGTRVLCSRRLCVSAPPLPPSRSLSASERRVVGLPVAASTPPLEQILSLRPLWATSTCKAGKKTTKLC